MKTSDENFAQLHNLNLDEHLKILSKIDSDDMFKLEDSVKFLQYLVLKYKNKDQLHQFLQGILDSVENFSTYAHKVEDEITYNTLKAQTMIQEIGEVQQHIHKMTKLP